MRARTKMLAAALGAVVVTSACSGIAQDSSRGSTLPPLDVQGPPPTDGTGSIPESSAPSTSVVVATTTAPTTSSSSLPPTTFTTTTTSTVPASTSTTEPAASGGSGVQATIAGRSIGAAEACLDGRNVTLNGVTWAFAGNSFRLSGDGDERSAAELVGNGWTMPMAVAGVSNGVYTYQGSPVDGSVRSAQVTVDFNELDRC